MSDNSKIEWTSATWSWVTGCTKISDGCLNCYIQGTPPFRIAHRRFSSPGIGGTTGVKLHSDRMCWPRKWRKPRKVFVNSLGDTFHEEVPTALIAEAFAVMAVCPQHIFQVLTKRHARMRALLNDQTFIDDVLARARQMDSRRITWPLLNVHLGVSAENQRWADIRIPALLHTPAAVRFISAEPLLGEIDLSRWLGDADGCAPESGERRISGRGDGRTDHRRARVRLEGRGEAWKQVGSSVHGDSMPTEESGTSGGQIPPSSRDVRYEALSRAGSPAGVETLRGPNPGWPDDQPQERQSHGEPDREPRTRHLRGANGACAEGSQARTSRPVGNPQRNGETDGGRRSGDLLAAGVRGAAASNSSGLWRGIPDDLADSERRPSISWLIAGGESGPGARPCDLEWLRSLCLQCERADVPFFCKQLGSVLGREVGAGPKGGDIDAFPEDLKVRQFPHTTEAVTV